MTKEPTEYFARVGWTVGDVMCVLNLSPEEAEQFLKKNERHIKDRMVEIGWEVIADLGKEQGISSPDDSNE